MRRKGQMSYAPRPAISRGGHLAVRSAVIAVVLSAGLFSSNAATGARRYGPGDTGVVNVSSSPDMAEGEQPLAVNPRNPNQIVVVSNTWQRTWPGPLSDLPGGNGIMDTSFYSSRYGGKTW